MRYIERENELLEMRRGPSTTVAGWSGSISATRHQPDDRAENKTYGGDVPDEYREDV